MSPQPPAYFTCQVFFTDSWKLDLDTEKRMYLEMYKNIQIYESCVVTRHQLGDIVKLIIVTLCSVEITPPNQVSTSSRVTRLRPHSVSVSNSIRFLYFKLAGSKRSLSRGPLLTTLIRRGPSACWKVYGADNELSNDNFWTDAGPHYFDLTASQCQLKEDLYRNGKRGGVGTNTHGRRSNL